MTVVVDYASLTQAIADWSHNPLLTAGSGPYSDAFIQRAQAQIERDIPAQNFGNYIRFQESTYYGTSILNGAAPVPADWLGPKSFQVNDGTNLWPLQFKNVNWLYDRYPQRTTYGIPAYIARDTVGVGGPSYLASSVQNFTATANQTVFPLTIPTGGAISSVTLDGAYFALGTDYTISSGTLTLTNGALLDQELEVTYLTPPSGAPASLTSQFVFGPYPDTAYTLQGTYYAKAALLNISNITNWMVLNVPDLLLAGCMVQAAMFLKDAAMSQLWGQDYAQRLTALVNADKAERWAASTMSIDAA